MTYSQDTENRYYLNDLHKVVGGEVKNKPANWFLLQSTNELVSELLIDGIPSVSRKTGRNGGTYVTRELVYAYTMWINPTFHLLK